VVARAALGHCLAGHGTGRGRVSDGPRASDLRSPEYHSAQADQPRPGYLCPRPGRIGRRNISGSGPPGRAPGPAPGCAERAAAGPWIFRARTSTCLGTTPIPWPIRLARESDRVFHADLHIRSRFSRDSGKAGDIEQRETPIPAEPGLLRLRHETPGAAEAHFDAQLHGARAFPALR
jgi:hypothetical protein